MSKGKGVSLKKYDIMGAAEVAEMFGVTVQAVANWRVRHEDFPAPSTVLRMGPIWVNQRAQLQDWMARRRG